MTSEQRTTQASFPIPEIISLCTEPVSARPNVAPPHRPAKVQGLPPYGSNSLSIDRGAYYQEMPLSKKHLKQRKYIEINMNR